MESIKLSKRLSIISNYVPYNSTVADIGSDHALLPSYLVMTGQSPFVIAGDINDGPIKAAKKQVKELNLENKIFVRKSDGLKVIENEKIDVITIAGMGGALITEILSNDIKKLEDTNRLILQPNVGSDLVRKWLDNNSWNIIAEEIVLEDDKIYEIIVSEKRKTETDPVYNLKNWSKEEMYRLGPLLWKEKSPTLTEKWTRELNKQKYILKQLNNIKDIEERERKQKEINKEIDWIMGVLKCL